MARFLSTTAISHELEELIKNAKEHLVIVSPFLKLKDRLRILIKQTNDAGVPMRVYFGKNELRASEKQWLGTLRHFKARYCQDLHAKCYLNESTAILSSMNLYDFSQINNYEMGVRVDRREDSELYRDIWDEIQRIRKASEIIDFGLDDTEFIDDDPAAIHRMMSTTQLARQRGINGAKLFTLLADYGLIIRKNDSWELTEQGKAVGGELHYNPRYGEYIRWPDDLKLD